MPYEKKLKEYSKLENRLHKSHLQYQESSMERLREIIHQDSEEKIARFEAIGCINHLLADLF